MRKRILLITLILIAYLTGSVFFAGPVLASTGQGSSGSDLTISAQNYNLYNNTSQNRNKISHLSYLGYSSLGYKYRLVDDRDFNLLMFSDRGYTYNVFYFNDEDVSIDILIYKKDSDGTLSKITNYREYASSPNLDSPAYDNGFLSFYSYSANKLQELYDNNHDIEFYIYTSKPIYYWSPTVNYEWWTPHTYLFTDNRFPSEQVNNYLSFDHGYITHFTPSVQLSPIGNYGDTRRDLDIYLKNVSYAFLYLETKNKELYLIDTFESFSPYEHILVDKSKIPYELLENGKHKFILYYYDLSTNLDNMLNKTKYTNLYYFDSYVEPILEPGEQPGQEFPDIDDLGNYDWSNIDYFIGPENFENNQIFKTDSANLKFVVRIPGTLQNYTLPVIYTVSNRTGLTYVASSPNELILSEDGQHLLYNVDLSVHLKEGTNYFVVNMVDRLPSDILDSPKIYAQEAYYLNKNIPGSVVGDYFDEGSGEIDTDFTLTKALKTFLNFMKDIGDFINSFTLIFTWLPAQIYALIVIALTLGIILRVVGRS